MEAPQIYGALKSPEDDADHIFENVAQGPAGYYWTTFPQEYDLRKFVKPSRDQGNRGACAAFTGATIKEVQSSKSGLYNGRLSPEFIYYHRENKPRPGMYGRDVMKILQTYGTVREEDYPYNQTDRSLDSPRKELYELAAQNRIAHFARVTTVNGLKKALLEIGACYLQLPLYKSRPYFWRPEPGEEYSGGHAVTVIGYNTDGFILQNSWGPLWNGDGCIVFPYHEWNIHLECWVATDEVIERQIPQNNVTVTHEYVHIHKKEPRETHSSSSSWTLSSAKSSGGTTTDYVAKAKKKGSNCAIM